MDANTGLMMLALAELGAVSVSPAEVWAQMRAAGLLYPSAPLEPPVRGARAWVRGLGGGGGSTRQLQDQITNIDNSITTINNSINNIVNATISIHEPVITAASFNIPGPLNAPNPINFNSTLLLSFTVGIDYAFRVFKISTRYTASEAVRFHIHWTKSSDLVETGRACRWRVEVDLFSGSGGVIPAALAFEIEDTYDAADTVERTIYRTPSVDIAVTTPGWYAGVSVTAVAPVGTALLSEPALYSLDITYPATVF